MTIDLLSGLGVDQRALAEFCERHQIVRLAVFGSAARGELRPDSDVDLMAEWAPDARFGLYDLVHMQDELRELFGRDVDLVERAAIKNPFRQRSIARDLQVVYAA